MAYFVVEFRFPADPQQRLVVRPRHRQYLSKLERAGAVVLAGPWADDSGALLVYAARDEAELQAVLARDPYVIEGVGGTTKVRAWEPIIGGTRLRARRAPDRRLDA